MSPGSCVWPNTPAIVVALADAGRTGSALRRRLKAAEIDPKLARLVMLLYRRDRLRVADIAWSLTISPSTASRWLDRAEQQGLVDKQYDDFDRRGTWARLTTRGVALRTRAEVVLGAGIDG
jgi:DNA-binding MarR family transcriptional regulator